MAGSNGLSVPITADTRVFQSQVDDVSDQLSKVADQLDQTTSAGDQAGSSIESAMRTAQAQTAAATDVFRQNTQVYRQGYQERISDTELGEGEINRIQKESLKTGAAAIASQLSQSVSGFDGTVTGALNSIANIGSGVAAFSQIPEVAIAAGGITLLVSSIAGLFQQSAADTKAFEADVSSMTATLEKSGISGVTSVSAIDAALKKMSTTTDGSDKDLAHLKSTADQAGVSFVTYSRALAGNTADQQKLYDAVSAQIPVLEKQVAGYNSSTHAQSGAADAARQQLAGLQAVQTALQNENKTLGESKDRVQDLADATQGASATEVAAQKAVASAVKTTDDLVVTAAQDTSDFYNPTTKKYDVAGYIANMQAAANSIQNTASFLISAPLSDSAKAFIQAQTPEVAAGIIAAYKQATPAQQAALNQTYSELGLSAGDKFNTAVASKLASDPLSATATLNLDTTQFDAKMRALLSSPYTVTVNTKLGKFGRTLQ